MLAELLFLSSAQRRLFQQGVPVLMYHKIDCVPRGTRDPFLYVSPARFNDQLRALSQGRADSRKGRGRLVPAGLPGTTILRGDEPSPSLSSPFLNRPCSEGGYTSTTLDTVPNVTDNRARQIVITFDDGAESVFKNALDILARHRFRALQFIVAGLIGKRNEWDIAKGESPDRMMDEAQIREWLAAGHEIGSHTSTHPNLKRVPLAQAREEIFGSKKKLEDTFGAPVRHFCYPSGKWNEPVRDLVAEAGYLTACAVEFGVNTSATPRFALRRVTPLSGIEWLKKARHRFGQRIFGSR